MKNGFVLLMALTLIGSVSADPANYGPGSPWGIAGNGLNPYGFDTDGDLTDLTEGTGENPDLWGTWGDSNAGAGPVVVSGGKCTIGPLTGTYEVVFSHDNALVDMGAIVSDDFEIVLVVDSISGPGYVSMKLECYDTDVFPNNDDGAGSIGVADWEAAGQTYDSTDGPGEYHFFTSDVGFEIPAGTLAVTPVITVAGGAGTEVVIDEIWIGPEQTCCPPPKAYNPSPANNSLPASGSVTQCTWTLPDPLDGTSAVNATWRFEKENATDGSGNYVYDPNWGAANGVPTTMKELTKGAGIEVQNFGFATSPYSSPLADGLYSWRVDATDASIGGVTTEGNVWLFYVGGDASPAVSWPDDQYMYVAQTDGDGDSNIRTFTVDWTYTDDGLSEITAVDVNNLNWGWDPLGPDGTLGTGDEERGVELVSIVRNPGAALPATITSETVTATFGTKYDAADPNYSTDIMGYWDIRLEVTDGSGTTLGIPAHHEIWELCGQAAASDPTDDFDATYDVDLNCKTDLTDLADFLSRWLNQSVLYE